MSLIIPTATSTFADACRTEGDALGKKYVLAQFRSDADLEWVRQLRSLLVTDELKYTKLRDARPKLRLQRELWKKVEAGVGQATIVVIDARAFELQAKQLIGAGANFVRDDLANKMLIEECATAIIKHTPISYLPQELARTVPWGTYQPIASLDDFAPENIRKKLGGGLKQTMIFAARAHAIFDLPSLDSSTTATWDLFRAPLARVLLAELLATERNFDNEDPKTATLLNQAADEIANALGDQLPIVGTISDKPLVREVDSRGIDEVQAADVAAGWAREVLETNDATTLGARFERVWINGRRIK